jgi:hypothetical protein
LLFVVDRQGEGGSNFLYLFSVGLLLETTDLGVLTCCFERQYSKEAIRQKLIKFGLLKEKQLLKEQQKSSNNCY